MIVLAGMTMPATGCAERWHYGFVTDAAVNLPPYSHVVERRQRAGSEPEWLDVEPGGDQTVLVAVWSKTEPSKLNEIESRTYVIVLDGPPAEGRYEVTPANGRFIRGTNWFPPRQPYEGLEGSVRIRSVSAGGIKAYCGLRNVLARPADPLYPLRGDVRFERVPAGRSRLGAVRFHAAVPAD